MLADFDELPLWKPDHPEFGSEWPWRWAVWLFCQPPSIRRQWEDIGLHQGLALNDWKCLAGSLDFTFMASHIPSSSRKSRSTPGPCCFWWEVPSPYAKRAGCLILSWADHNEETWYITSLMQFFFIADEVKGWAQQRKEWSTDVGKNFPNKSLLSYNIISPNLSLY